MSCRNPTTLNSCACGCGKLVKYRFAVGHNRRVDPIDNTTHGMSYTAEHRTWRGMLGRCYNPNGNNWAEYGGRGITVCDQWRHNFAAFYADMGPRPNGTTLDRIDNEGPYAPENCRWATRREQARNTRRVRYLTANGQTMIMDDWVRTTGLKRATITARLKLGWSQSDAVTLPLVGKRECAKRASLAHWRRVREAG